MNKEKIEEEIYKKYPQTKIFDFVTCKSLKSRRLTLTGADPKVNIGKSLIAITDKGLIPVVAGVFNTFKIHSAIDTSGINRMTAKSNSIACESKRMFYMIKFPDTDSKLKIQKVIEENDNLSPAKTRLGVLQFSFLAVLGIMGVSALLTKNVNLEKTSEANQRSAMARARIEESKDKQKQKEKQNDAGKEKTLFDAYYFACQEVKRRLKSPSSAKFSDFKESFVTKLDKYNQFTVLSHVEAQNSFGVMTKQMFNCQVNFMKDSAEIDCHIWDQ